MNIKHPIIAASTLFLFPILAHAEPTEGTENSMLTNLLYGFLPIIIIGLFLYFFLKRYQSSKNPRVRKYDEYVQRQVQHMERVEQRLERIAKSLEKRD